MDCPNSWNHPNCALHSSLPSTISKHFWTFWPFLASSFIWHNKVPRSTKDVSSTLYLLLCMTYGLLVQSCTWLWWPGMACLIWKEYPEISVLSVIPYVSQIIILVLVSLSVICICIHTKPAPTPQQLRSLHSLRDTLLGSLSLFWSFIFLFFLQKTLLWHRRPAQKLVPPYSAKRRLSGLEEAVSYSYSYSSSHVCPASIGQMNDR